MQISGLFALECAMFMPTYYFLLCGIWMQSFMVPWVC
jgi:hypothetical protein